MMMMIDGAISWLQATGAPNWVVIVAILTHPAYWAKQLKTRVSPVLNRYLPSE
ncbi:hypothetical protein HFTV1-gp34 [Haloferax tailed virus 1]|uniref:Uncharacterized protein n=1 Tax=Haloferax tailed virus 1 TaxID=2507575 RepID=A0A410N6S5_HFTV1|nr:hypothetical protein M1M17_gp34 [Haloferax tailed virus 1]QAS68867.1 hypothetical protein HFTV1-gp34 [Haloferax tailed virus 1]